MRDLTLKEMKREVIGVIAPEDILRRLMVINHRLYAPEALTDDERRDLANAMDSLLSQFEPIYEGELAS